MMDSFDRFCGDIIEQSKRLLEKAKEQKEEDDDGKRAYLNSSLLLSISALDAYVNGITSELLLSDEFSILEQSLLSEKEIEFKNGQFILKKKLKMSRTIDKIEFLYNKHSNKSIKEDKLRWWSPLKQAIDLRNKLVHPKESLTLDVKKVEKALGAILDCINSLYTAIYSTKLPIHNLGLQSKYDF